MTAPCLVSVKGVVFAAEPVKNVLALVFDTGVVVLDKIPLDPAQSLFKTTAHFGTKTFVPELRPESKGELGQLNIIPVQVAQALVRRLADDLIKELLVGIGELPDLVEIGLACDGLWLCWKQLLILLEITAEGVLRRPGVEIVPPNIVLVLGVGFHDTPLRTSNRLMPRTHPIQ